MVIEQEIRSAAEKEMLRCRPGDWEHAKRVAQWANVLGKERDDIRLLTVAALIHDIGWRDVLPSNEKITFDQLLTYEPQANQNSESYVTTFLNQFHFSQDEIAQILRLVKAADEHRANQPDEAVIVDADNLSKLDIAHLKEKYQPSEWMRMHDLWSEEYPSRITTLGGQRVYKTLLEALYRDILKTSQY